LLAVSTARPLTPTGNLWTVNSPATTLKYGAENEVATGVNFSWAAAGDWENDHPEDIGIYGEYASSSAVTHKQSPPGAL
jgi:hypothetical protein